MEPFPRFRFLPLWPLAWAVLVIGLAPLLCVGGETAASTAAESSTGSIAGDEPPAPPPALPPGTLRAHGFFFEDAIELTARVIPVGFGAGPGPGGRPAGEGERRRRPPRGDGGGGMGGGPPPGGDGGAGMPVRVVSPSVREQNGMPRHVVLELTNHRAEPLAVEVIDFKSDFGNFAVRPARIKIAPGESVRAEPMLSRLEVSGEEFPLEVRLIVGVASDERTLVLRAEAPSKPGSDAAGNVEPAAVDDPGAPPAPEN